MTAVTRPAEARRRASRMMKSSIRFSLIGWQVGWTTNTSWPRIESWILTSISPSGKRRTRGSVSGTDSSREISSANSGLALPEISLSAPHGEVSSLAYSTAVCSLPIICTPSRDLRLLPAHARGHAHHHGVVGDVAVDHRAGAGLGAPAHLAGGDEDGVDAHVGAVPDLGRELHLLLAVVVGRDRAGADVDALADGGVAQVGDVGHRGAGADPGAHDLGEAADVDPEPDLGARPQLA